MVRIGNAQGFWGDSDGAPAALLAQQPDLDYLTLDYLAEVSLGIMAAQRAKDPSAGYARDFVEVIQSLAPFWKKGSACKLVTNAGGLNPNGCAEACIAALRERGCSGLKIAVVTGDDVLPLIRRKPDDAAFNNLETGAPIATVLDRLTTASAYLGAQPIAEALGRGADIVLTCRVADPSLTLGPCVHHYGWKWTDYDRLAGGTIAGHLIECGTQVSGGIATHWLDVPDNGNIGYPFVEVREDGSCVVTKPAGTGGAVNERTVKEQLLYELGDPAQYRSPDVTVSILDLRLRDDGPDRVRVEGATGAPPGEFYKVSATYRDGYWAHGTLTIFGRHAVAKARRSGEVVFEQVRRAGFELARTNIECLGANACAPGVLDSPDLLETVLRISAADARREAVECFAKMLMPLVCGGAQGTTGYAAGRPRVSPVFGYWPCLVPKSHLKWEVEIVEV